MWKRITSVMVPMLLVCALLVQTAYAVEQRVVYDSVSLSFQGKSAVCTAICKGESASDQIEATLTLYQGTAYVGSWRKSGKRMVSFSEECAVTSGKSYRLVLTYSINGVAQSSKSMAKTCP